MTESDKPNCGRLLSDALGFYRQDVSQFTLDVWWAACNRFDIEQVRKALTAHALDPDRGQFAPKPADLIRVLEGTHGDRSLMAWAKVFDAMSAVGAWQSVAFDDAAIHAAVTDIGGWQAVCRGNLDQLPHLQRRFCDAHRAYTRRGAFEYPRRLVGDVEASNSHAGYAVPPPVLVGDLNMARAVMAGGSMGSRTALTFQAAIDVLRIEPPVA